MTTFNETIKEYAFFSEPILEIFRPEERDPVCVVELGASRQMLKQSNPITGLDRP